MTALNWALVVATKDRLEPLLFCLRFALAQSRPPAEIIIVDASSDWEGHRSAAAAILAARPEIHLDYRPASKPSAAVQRNQGIAAATADVLFLIDDDSFLYPDAAEEVMRIYEADHDHRLAGVQLFPAATSPGEGPATRQQESAGIERIAARPGLRRRLIRKLLSYGPEGNFTAYDEAYPDRPIPETLQGFDIRPARLFEGFRMTLRRPIAAQLLFEPLLLYYSPGEDLDLSYRASREGLLVTARTARVHHFGSGDGRLKRHQIALLSTLNLALFLRRNAADQSRARARHLRDSLHRAFAGALLDLAQRRLHFPKVRGTLHGLRLSRRIFGSSIKDLERLYPAMQQRIVTGTSDYGDDT